MMLLQALRDVVGVLPGLAVRDGEAAGAAGHERAGTGRQGARGAA
jgi:hypothetical protein